MGRPVDFFVSYAGPDRPWAEWVAQQLERHDFAVELAAWDWSAGDNFVLRMNDALERADRVLALYSPAYFARDRFTTQEWSAVLADERGAGRLVPVRVAEVTPPPILRPLVFRDLFGLPELRARQVLLEAVAGSGRPLGDVPFPDGGGGARVPGSLPPVWNVRRRHPLFTGRERELAALRDRLCSGARALVQALHGIGGVGKTELAVEYAHLFANEYHLVWWIDAERPELVGEQLAALATAAGWAGADIPVAAAAGHARQRLQQIAGWLLIFDNAETVDAIADWIPDGPGHVVITSRSDRHGGIATAIGIDVLDRASSLSLLRKELPTLPAAEADRLAAAVQDLPLALGQAAGLLTTTGMSVDDYLGELSADPAAVMAEGPTGRYRRPLAAVVETSMRRLTGSDEGAGQVMRLVSVLAPEAVPVSWLIGTPAGTLPEPLGTASAFAVRRMLGRLAGLGLARVDHDTLQVHRLTQAVIAPAVGERETGHADLLLAAAAPGDQPDPESWARWAALLPHLLVRVPLSTNRTLRRAAAQSIFYLLQRGEHRTAHALALAWHRRWAADSGPDDLAVLAVAQQLANSYHVRGEYDQAHRLRETALAGRRRVLGPDHPDTLNVAANLAVDLARLDRYEQSRRLQEEVFEIRRRVLGADHADTLTSAANLASTLRDMGEAERSRGLLADILARHRRTLGDDHPITLRTACNYANALTSLGRYEQSRRIEVDVLARRRRILGADHPDTLLSAHNLAVTLYLEGDVAGGLRLLADTVARRRRVLGADHPDTVFTADLIARWRT